MRRPQRSMPQAGRHPRSVVRRWSLLLESCQAQRIIASAQCDGTSPASRERFAARGSVDLYRAQVSIADALPPVHRVPPSGSLLDASKPIRVSARSGSTARTPAAGCPQPWSSIADGVHGRESPITRAACCADPFIDRCPCPLDGRWRDRVRHDSPRERWRIDPGGARRRGRQPHAVRAGQRSRAQRQGPERRRRHPRSEAHSALPRPARLVRRVGFGKTAVVTGQARGCAGAPIGGRDWRSTSAWTGSAPRARGRDREDPRQRALPLDHDEGAVAVHPRRLSHLQADLGDAASAEVKLAVRARIAIARHSAAGREPRPDHVPRATSRRAGKGGSQLAIEAVGRDVRSRVPVDHTAHRRPRSLPVLVPLPALVRAVHVPLPRAPDAPGVVSIRGRRVADRDGQDRALRLSARAR